MQIPDSVINIMQENNRSELERLDRERNDDFLSMLKGFVINQVLLFAEWLQNIRCLTMNYSSEVCSIHF